MGKASFYLGEAGKGANMKLVVNMVSHAAAAQPAPHFWAGSHGSKGVQDGV